ncbi:hypothetical protein [Halohasta salina]|uniref:hypothetical protein n=1 Tax=Halohasta salina TaxID=2961621 RepID=UPI0020A30CA1|nr:hypothetical protein [Halohasta salina]
MDTDEAGSLVVGRFDRSEREETRRRIGIRWRSRIGSGEQPFGERREASTDGDEQSRDHQNRQQSSPERARSDSEGRQSDRQRDQEVFGRAGIPDESTRSEPTVPPASTAVFDGASVLHLRMRRHQAVG